MVFLGLVLAVAAAVFAVGIAMENADPAELVVFGETVPGVTNVWQVFFAGAALAVVFVLGLVFTFVGMGRMIRARRDLRYLREEHEESLTTLELEKRELQRELARIRQAGGAPRPQRPDAAAQRRGAPSRGPNPAAAAPAAAPTAAPANRSQVTANSSFFERND
ncbi:hypothetical protein [Actinomadura rudentiformis]|uniref:hypothetical protein n=1 Tax=Actinomadura rudentiformis TaxID=359158 RepID=UPI00178C270A|nr:hypothetical protein [Actinomadura rudentiformis]